MVQVQGQVLYDNAARDADATVTWDGTTVAGKEFQNSYDWIDWTLFEVEAGQTDVNLDIQSAGGRTIDSAGLYIKPLAASDTATIVLQYESAPATFTDIQTFNITDQGTLILQDLTSQAIGAGLKIRWKITTNADSMIIRQLTVGERLDFPIGQRGGMAPPNLNGSYVMNSTIAVNGAVLSRSTRRLDRQMEIDLEYLSEDFVRNEWAGFTDHASRNAFYYRWNKVGFPDEATFASAEKIPRPTNIDPPPLMAAKLPIRCQVNESNI